MSWFVGIFPKKPLQNETQISNYLRRLKEVARGAPRLTIADGRMILIGGGLAETFKFKQDMSEGGRRGWLVCGTGIRRNGNTFSLMGEDDWDKSLRGEPAPEELQKTNGHYAIVTWNENRVEFFTDGLELRRIYISETDEFFVASTRLDWLAPFLSRPELEMETIASGWTLTNSFCDESFVKDTIRVGPSGHAVLEDGSLIHTSHHWMPGESHPDRLVQDLQEIALLPLQAGRKLTLGLSGGVDSRTLLALIVGSDKGRWQVHSCGDKDNLDVLIAKQIAEALGVRHRVLYYDLHGSDTAESVAESIRECSLQTEMSDSPFGYPRFTLFSEMNEDGYWMVDGAYGELLRRSDGTKLLAPARKLGTDKNVAALMRPLLLPKSKIFKEEIQAMFLKEAEAQLEKAVRAMPDSLLDEDIGNWIDLFHVRYRLKNYAAASQGMYDYHIPSYMPFATPSMISTYLSLSSRRKMNNKLARRIVSGSDKHLREIPLIVSGSVVPYWTSRNLSASRALGHLKRRFDSRKQDTELSFRVKALLLMKELVFDRYGTAEVRTYPYYDHAGLRNHIENFYGTPSEADAQFIEDWLMFDFWRERLASGKP